MTQPKLFAGLYLFAFTGVLASALSINVLGNAAGVFPSPLFPASSERAWKTRRLEQRVRESRVPKIIILGSSRMMQIQPDYVQAVTGKTAFNYGVSSAAPIEYLPQLQYLLQIGCRPEMVLVGVDESAFRYGGTDGLIENLGHKGLFMAMPIPIRLEILATALQRIDVDSTQRSLSRLVGKKQAVHRGINDVDHLLLENGYLIYCNHLREIEKGTFDLAANIRVDLNNEEWKTYRRKSLLTPNPRELSGFEVLLQFCKVNGIEVRVVFLPLQPDYEAQFFTPELLRARKALSLNLQSMCRQYSAAYRDFTNLASFGGDPKQFYDGIHQTPVNMRRIINVLFGVRPGEIVADLPTDSDILKHLPRVTTLTTE